jgi:hypothetical protein
VESVAVSLNDQRALAPEEVDFEGADTGVDLWPRQPVALAEPQEAPLELAAGKIGLEAILLADVES